MPNKKKISIKLNSQTIVQSLVINTINYFSMNSGYLMNQSYAQWTRDKYN